MNNLEFERAFEYYADNDSKCILRVCKSNLPGCDFYGLYSTAFIAKGQVICKYFGTHLRTKEALQVKDKSYLMRLGEQCYVDAREHLHVKARYINDCINPIGWNVFFDKQPKELCAWVIALRDVHPNEELFVDYGKWYWNNLQPIRLSLRQIIEMNPSYTAQKEVKLN